MSGILLYIIISVLFGGISCFFGKRLYFPVLMLTVFAYSLTLIFSLFDFTWKVGAAALIVGSIASLLSVALYKLGVFLLGGILGAGIGQLLFSILQINAEWAHLVMVLVPALTLGFCALKWCRLFIMASTAYGGAASATLSLGFLAVHIRELPNYIYADGIVSTMANLNAYLQGAFAQQYAVPIFIFTFILAFAGFMFQYRAEG